MPCYVRLLDSVRRELRRQNEYDKRAKFFLRRVHRRRKNNKRNKTFSEMIFFFLIGSVETAKNLENSQDKEIDRTKLYMISEPPGTFFGQLRKTNGLSFFP